MDRAESGTPAGRTARWARPQAHLAPCRSCCTRSAGAARDLLLLKRPRDAQVLRVRQVTAAGAAPFRVVILGPVRDLPRHRRARAARLLSPFLLLRALRRPPLLPGRFPPRQVIRRRRHRRIPAVPRPRPLRSRQLLPQVSDHRLQRRDLLRLRREPPLLLPEQLRLLPDQRIPRISRLRIGHNPQSSRNHAQLPRQHHSRRRNVTNDHPPQLQAQGPECLLPVTHITIYCCATLKPQGGNRRP